VFWGSCVVFWCSFWVGFWLSESLRGVFTPARNGRRQSSPVHGGGWEGGMLKNQRKDTYLRGGQSAGGYNTARE
jgi:hypothetical protein